MDKKEIDEVVKAYGEAVRLAIKAGFDAVEIHAGHGYLISAWRRSQRPVKARSPFSSR